MKSERVERLLVSLLKKIRKDTSREFRTGLFIYTILFFIIAAGTLGKIFYRTGTIAGGDGSSQYFSMLLDFRRNVLNLIQSIAEGNFALKMLNYEFMFGSDVLTTSTYFVLPFLPLYFLSVFVPEEFLPAFFASAVILLSYLSGISNIIMCRHFKADVLWSCIFAPAYVFCGSYFNTMVWNPQFISMMIVFPLMIIGMNLVINNKSGLLFVLCIAHLGLYGVTFLVYTLPFVVLFAVAELCFIKSQNFWQNFFRCFFRGILCIVTGLALSAFFLLPFLYTLSNSFRHAGTPDNIIKLFVPSSDYISDTLYCYDINRPIGLCPALIPFLLFCVFSVKSEKKHKIISAGALFIVSLPVVWYGLNGFMYELIRWGFIASCLFSFIASYYAPEVFELKKNGSLILFTGMTLYLIAFPFGCEYFSFIIIIIGSIITSSQKLYQKTGSSIKYVKDKYLSINSTLRHYLRLLSVIVFVISVLMITEIFVLSPYYNISKGILYIFISVGVITFITLLWKKNNKRCMMSLIGGLLFSISTVLYLVTCRNELNPAHTVRADEFYQQLKSYEEDKTDQNCFGRYISISNEKERYIQDSSFEYQQSLSESHIMTFSYAGINTSERNIQTNIALKYGIPSSQMFSSTIDRDYMSFLERCGMDSSSLASLVDAYGYSNKEAVYSLLGVKYMYSDYDGTGIYGAVSDNSFNYKDKHIFINKYALPVGVTYDNVINKKQFEDFNSAELPYAMMNSVYLENNEISNVAEKEYSRLVDITHERKYRENMNKYYDFTDNIITINDDVSDGFVYLEFTGLSYKSLPDNNTCELHIAVDNNDEIISEIVNNDSNWPWLLPRDHYTISLGFCEETIHTIEFMAFFDFDDVEIIYVPESVYTGGYEKITEETLKNVELGTNTLTGDITVSSDKVLSINLLHNDGWTAYVDGVKTPIYKANGLFLGIKLKEGSHKIRLVYRTPFLYEGMVISVLTLVLIVVIYTVKRKKHIGLTH